MKTNIAILLDDDSRNRLAILFDGGKQSKRLCTRKELNEFVTACIDAALALNPQENFDGGIEGAVDTIIPDINAGGWSFIGE